MFKEGARALRALGLVADDTYACPACLARFSLEEIDELSFEHVPPLAVGGARLALTCKSCNNSSGTHFDAHLERREVHIDFAAGLPTRDIDAVVIHEDVALRGNVRCGDDSAIVFGGVPAANKQGAAEESTRVMERWSSEGAEGRSIRIELREPFSLRKADIAAVRAAYLTAFALFGYSYILNPELDVIRDQLSQPDAEIMTPLPTVFSPNGDRNRREVLVVSDPDWFQRAMAITIGRCAVFLPSRNPEDGFFERLAAAMEQHATDGQVAAACSGVAWTWPTRSSYAFDFRNGRGD